MAAVKNRGAGAITRDEPIRVKSFSLWAADKTGNKHIYTGLKTGKLLLQSQNGQQHEQISGAVTLPCCYLEANINSGAVAQSEKKEVPKGAVAQSAKADRIQGLHVTTTQHSTRLA